MQDFGSVKVEEHVHGDTLWVALRARGAEWSWLTAEDALRLARHWMCRPTARRLPRRNGEPPPDASQPAVPGGSARAGNAGYFPASYRWTRTTPGRAGLGCGRASEKRVRREAGPEPPRSSPGAPPGGRLPMTRRGWLAIVLLLAAGGGGFWWWSTRRPAPVEWQGYAEADFVKVGPTQQGC